MTHRQTCKDPLCRRCQKRRAAKIIRTLRPMIKEAKADGYRPVFMTPTQLDLAGESAVDAYTRFRESWAKLIRSDEFKSHVDASILFVDSTHSNEKNWWHFHGHVLLLVRGDFWDREEVMRLWGKFSPGAWNVDLRSARQGVEAELAGYALKIPELGDEQILEYAMLKGKRFISGTGAWKGGLVPTEEEAESRKAFIAERKEANWPYGDEKYVAWEVLCWRRDQGDEVAAKVLLAFKKSAELHLQSKGRADPLPVDSVKIRPGPQLPTGRTDS